MALSTHCSSWFGYFAVRGCGICVALLAFCLSAPASAQEPRPALVFYNQTLYGPDVQLRGLPLVANRLRDGKLSDARILIEKAQHRMVLYAGKELLKAYRIELGLGGLDSKTRLGDARTPTGEYYICEHRQQSTYHKALLLSYPNAEDARRGREEGLITPAQEVAIRMAIERKLCPPQDTPLGGWIMIHGQHPKLTQWIAESRESTAPTDRSRKYLPGDLIPATLTMGHDWTLGCIALANPDIRELYELLPRGTPVTIQGNLPR